MFDWFFLILAGFLLSALVFVRRLKIPNTVWIAALFFFVLVNALADTTTNMLTVAGLSTGVWRAMVILPLLVILVSGQMNRHFSSISIFIFLVFVYMLLWFSSDIGESTSNYFKLLISLLAFPLALRFIRTVQEFKYLAIAILIATLILEIQIVVAQIFKLGASNYADDSFYVAGALPQAFNVWVLAILLWPVFLSLFTGKRQQLISNLVLIVASVFSILLARRGIYLAIAGGLLVNVLFSKQKSRLIKPIIGAAFVLILLWPSISTTVNARLEGRLERLAPSQIESEARMLETMIVLEELQNNSFEHTLFGTDVLNSAGYFIRNSARYYVFSRRTESGAVTARNLHIDYNEILHGAGIIGLSLYLLIHVLIAWQFSTNYKRANQEMIPFDARAAFWSIFVAGLIISLSGGLLALGYRFLLFAVLGGLVGLMEASSQETERENGDFHGLIPLSGHQQHNLTNERSIQG